MPKEMLINVSAGEECRIAVVEDGKLEELYMERASSQTHVGNVYKGKVTNVEASIQAAFIDFGIGRNGFLHVSDLMPAYWGGGRGEHVKESVGRKMARRDRPPIQQCLRRGDEIIVQVIKEGLGTKGPTLSSYLSIPGRILVMMPGVEKSGVSKKIEDDDERRRLRDILDELDPPKGAGFIIRTAGVDKSKGEIERDFKYLMRLWETIQEADTKKAPLELYAEGDLVMRTVRDVWTSDIDKIVVDDKETAKRIKDFFKVIMPRTKNKIEVYDEAVPLFHAYKVERDIEQMNSRTVPLPSGGSLVIDQTEALVAIDVNSGKSRADKDAETSAFKTDLEAADEIPRQLKLRDLGGVVICDFIDLRYERHRRELEMRLAENLKRDRAKTRFLQMSEFGVIEMTRQRMRPSLKKSVYHECPHCAGQGLVKTPESMGLDVVRRLAIAAHDERVRRVELSLHPEVAVDLLNRKRAEVAQLEEETEKKLIVKIDDDLAQDEMRFELFDEREGTVHLEALGSAAASPEGRIGGGRDRGSRGGRRPGAQRGPDRDDARDEFEGDPDAPAAGPGRREPDPDHRDEPPAPSRGRDVRPLPSPKPVIIPSTGLRPAQVRGPSQVRGPEPRDARPPVADELENDAELDEETEEGFDVEDERPTSARAAGSGRAGAGRPIADDDSVDEAADEAGEGRAGRASNDDDANRDDDGIEEGDDAKAPAFAQGRGEQRDPNGGDFAADDRGGPGLGGGPNAEGGGRRRRRRRRGRRGGSGGDLQGVEPRPQSGSQGGTPVGLTGAPAGGPPRQLAPQGPAKPFGNGGGNGPRRDERGGARNDNRNDNRGGGYNRPHRPDVYTNDPGVEEFSDDDVETTDAPVGRDRGGQRDHRNDGRGENRGQQPQPQRGGRDDRAGQGRNDQGRNDRGGPRGDQRGDQRGDRGNDFRGGRQQQQPQRFGPNQGPNQNPNPRPGPNVAPPRAPAAHDHDDDSSGPGNSIHEPEPTRVKPLPAGGRRGRRGQQRRGPTPQEVTAARMPQPTSDSLVARFLETPIDVPETMDDVDERNDARAAERVNRANDRGNDRGNARGGQRGPDRGPPRGGDRGNDRGNERVGDASRGGGRGNPPPSTPVPSTPAAKARSGARPAKLPEPEPELAPDAARVSDLVEGEAATADATLAPTTAGEATDATGEAEAAKPKRRRGGRGRGKAKAGDGEPPQQARRAAAAPLPAVPRTGSTDAHAVEDPQDVLEHAAPDVAEFMKPATPADLDYLPEYEDDE